jgi:acetyltransferase-like isoleucine patch superfamily enzyme
MGQLIARLWAGVEFAGIALLGKLFGVGMVVRYLRNPNPRVTVRLMRAFGARVGDRTRFKRAVLIDNAYEDRHSTGDLRHLRVGANCYIGDGVYFDLADAVVLEDDVVISGEAAFVTHADCNRSPDLSRAFPRQCNPIRIRRGAWVAFRATILDGVTVGQNAVVAAHALVREDAEAGMIHGGTPARPIRPVEEPRRVVTLRLVRRGR